MSCVPLALTHVIFRTDCISKAHIGEVQQLGDFAITRCRSRPILITDPTYSACMLAGSVKFALNRFDRIDSIV